MTVATPDNLKNLHTSRYNDLCVAKGDTGASHQYWMKQDTKILKNVTKINGPHVKLPNNELISATSQGELPLSNDLSSAAKKAMIFN